MHLLRCKILLLSTLLWACIEPPPAANTKSDVGTTDTGMTDTGMTDTDQDTSMPDMSDDFDLTEESCKDGVKSLNETDIDCGGDCQGCATGLSCEDSSDCLSNMCGAGVCETPDECTVTGTQTLEIVYANEECPLISLPAGAHVINAEITRNVTLQGTENGVFLGALTISGDRVKLINIEFVGQNQTGGGGAISHKGGKLTLEKTRFTECTSTIGGAISTTGKLEVLNSNFVENSAKHGGAIYAAVGSTVAIIDSVFSENKAKGDGAHGGAIWSNSDLKIVGTQFTDNEAFGIGADTSTASGGAIFSASGNTLITTTTFQNNKVNADADAKGGAITNKSGTLTTYDVTFIGNAVKAANADGGAVYIRVGNSTFQRTAFIDNSAEGNSCNGGAVAKIDKNVPQNNDLFFENVTFGENSLVCPSLLSGMGGAAIHGTKCKAKLFSVTFNNNKNASSASNPDGESVYFNGCFIEANNSIFADSSQPVLGSTFVPDSSRNISSTSTVFDATVRLDMGLTALTTVKETEVYDIESGSPARNSGACKSLLGMELGEDQAGYTRIPGSCYIGAFQGQ